MTSKQDYRDYVDLYPDLVAAQQASGLSKAAFGERHWENHGKNNNNDTNNILNNNNPA